MITGTDTFPARLKSHFPQSSQTEETPTLFTYNGNLKTMEEALAGK